MESKECELAKGLFSDHFDRELEAGDEQFVRGHLESCPPCREAYASYERTFLAVRGLPPLAVSESFETRLHGRIRREGAPRRARWWSDFSRIPLPVPLAAAALLLLSIVSFNRYSADTVAPPAATVAAEAENGAVDRATNTRPSFAGNLVIPKVGSVVDLSDSHGPPRPSRSLILPDERTHRPGELVGVPLEGPYPQGMVDRIEPTGVVESTATSTGRAAP